MDKKLQTTEIKKNVDEFLAYFERTDLAVNPSLKAQCWRWINKLCGVTKGFLHEKELAEVALTKRRNIILGTGGDVVVGGSRDLFQKSTEAKTVCEWPRTPARTCWHNSSISHEFRSSRGQPACVRQNDV